MPKRNFDNYTIIQRLQNRIYARNLYINNTTGQAMINNPQTTDGSSSRMASYRAGAQTEYYKGLKGGETISLGGSLIILPFTVPDAPISLTATPSNGQVSISFTQGFYGRSPITNYLYSIDNGAFVACSPVSIVSPVIITGLTNAITYSIQLKAVNSIGASVASDVIVATPIAVPFPPTNLVVTPSNRQVSISFTPGFDEGNPIINYEYSTDGVLFTPFHPAKITGPLVITDLTNGASYSIKLKAVNRIGASLSSSGITTIPLTVPSAPTNLSAIASDKQVSISFTQGFNGGSNIMNYAYSIDGVSFNEIDPIDTISPVVIKNLTNGRTYSITLTAINKAGPSVSSEYIIAKPVAVPSAPTILSAIPSNRQISISFTPGFDGGEPIKNYQYSIDNDLFITTTTATTQVIKNLNNGTPLENGISYSIMLRAINDIGASITSNTVSAIPMTIPSAPTILEASITTTNQKITIPFTQGSTGGNAIINYEYSTNGITFTQCTIDGLSGSIIITTISNGTSSLENGINYSIQIRARNAAGPSASTTVSATPKTIPSAPTILEASITTSNQQITIPFTQDSNGGSTIINYEYSTNGTTFKQCTIDAISGSIIITTISNGDSSVENGTNYSIQIRAINAAGPSASTTVSATPKTIPSAPTILQASITTSNQQITIPFTQGSTGGSEIINYEYSTNGTTFKQCTIDAISGYIIITKISNDDFSLENGTNYSIQIRATNAAGPSASTTVSATPKTTPSAPTELTAIPTDKQAIISFTEGFNGGSNIENYAYSLNNDTFTMFDPPKKTGSLVIGGLINGTLYSIKLKAITIVGESVASSAVSVTPYTVPSTPLIISNSISDKQINIMTDQESNGGSAFINYEYSTDGINFRLFNPAITLDNNRYGTLSITKLSLDGTTLLTTGILYSIQIRAVNIAGPSASTTLSATPATFPDPPTGLSATVGNKIVRIDFTLGANGGSEITNYEYSTDGITFIEFAPVDKTSPVFISKQSIVGTPALVNGTAYSIKLKAKNSIGLSVASSTLLAKPYGIPEAPTITSVNVSSQQISLYFTQGSDNGSTIYNYEYSTDGTTFTRFNPATIISPVVISGLVNGTTYTYQLMAVNAAGRGSAASGTVKVQTAPSPPTITSITAGDSQLTVNFTPGDNGGNSIILYSYILDYPNVSQGSGTFAANNSTNSFTFTGLINGVSYGYKLAAKTSYEQSGQSDYTAFAYGIPARPGGNTVPSAPSIFQIAFGPYTANSSLTFYVMIGDNGGLPITYAEYKVWNSSETEPVLTHMIPYTSGPITTSNKINYDLLQINTWYVKIKLINGVGESPWSSTASRTNS